MSRLRLALVARRYWPLWSEGGQNLAALAAELVRQGHAVRVVTPSYEEHWPTELVVDNVPVVRLAQPRPRWWGTLRFLQSLRQWLVREAGNLDGVIVSGLRYDAWCVCKAIPRRGVKVILRAETAGERSDIAWQDQAFLGGRIRKACRASAALVAPTEEIETELRKSFVGVRVEHISNGVELRTPANAEERQAARNALREVNHDLTLDDRAPLVVYLGRLERSLGVFDLIHAWRDISARWPLARLWLIGDGPQRQALWELISDLDLRYRICLPGTFDDLTDILQAANVAVVPNRSGGPSACMLHALSAGVPVVATAIDSSREVACNAAVFVPPGKPEELMRGIAQLLENSALAASIAAAGRERAMAFSLAEMARRHVELLLPPQT